jgi:ribosomal RNA assembly protein
MIDIISIPMELAKKVDEKSLEKICKELDVKIERDKKMENVFIIEGEPNKILKAKQIFEAIGKNFEIKDALLLSSDDYFLFVINVKEFTRKRNRAIQLKGRVIGEKGKAKRFIEKMTNTKISIYKNSISIIGRYEDVLLAKKAIEMLLEGKKHSTVFLFLEKEVSKKLNNF